LDDKLMVDYN